MIITITIITTVSFLEVVDPGFPIGSVNLLRGIDLQRGCFLVKVYAKMRIGSSRGVRWARPLDPPLIKLHT